MIESAGFEDQPKNVTVLQEHNATLTFSTQGCESVLGKKKFIESGATGDVLSSEISVTNGEQQGQKLYKITLSNVTEPVEVWFEAFETPSSRSKNIRSQTASVLVQGCVLH